MILLNTKDIIVDWFGTICDEMIGRGTPIEHVRADPAGEIQDLIRLMNTRGIKVEFSPPGTSGKTSGSFNSYSLSRNVPSKLERMHYGTK